ncbi:MULTISPECIES: TadE/TadG family type IV pilus assembly protein [unclassified Devosia]|uniref:TadE/TadG family type IV pilus assembly protein n=1 Tax=unclassified Devosia TaxID=196773 RepID=UPI00145CF710|nr:TadE/TadG family type IV pilus assembly protein [Devosia sp. MC521]MBJ6987208.1 pilus assembly protein [Devosia sp. MC521]MBJ7577405.1 pilus assembly protein [Devosia sp. MC532]QMW62822.1 pilus assembly protein [Devosia sp. MC521]
MFRAYAKLRRNSDGAAAVEFAILTPVFLLLLTGMLAYGIYFGASLSLQQLAADAARTSIAGINDTERRNLVERFLIKNAGAYILLNTSTIAHDFEITRKDANQFAVTLTYDASDLPIWNLYVPLPLPSKIIEHQATIRNGGI